MEKALQTLKRSGLITNASLGRFQFAAPLVRIIMGQRLFTSRLSLEPSSNKDFEQFLYLSIERMRASELRNSLSHGNNIESRLLERAWQQEWGMAASSAVPRSHTMSPDVRAAYGSSDFMDFYINDGINWGVELMREGNRMNDHVKRFTPTGQYKKIPLRCWVITDFRHNFLVPDRNNLENNVWYALYENDYSKTTIVRQGKDDMEVVLRGDEFWN